MFFIGIKALSMIVAKYGVVNYFLCEKILFQNFPHWNTPFNGPCRNISGHLYSHIPQFFHFSGKYQPRAVSENFATSFSGEWNPIYSLLKM